MEGLIITAYIVLGLLNVMLFFKIWGMTDDVRELKRKYAEGEDPGDKNSKSQIVRLSMLGRKEEAVAKLNSDLNKYLEIQCMYVIRTRQLVS